MTGPQAADSEVRTRSAGVQRATRRTVLAAAGLAPVTAAAMACQQSPSAGSTAPGGQYRGPKVNIAYWFHPNNPVILRLVDDFNAAQELIKVEPTFLTTAPGGGSSDPLLASMVAGTPPEVANQATSGIPDWAAKGTLLALDDRLKGGRSGISVKDYFSALQEQISWKDKVYALPLVTDARALYWNKELYQGAGLPPDQPPRSIEQLDDYAQRLTRHEDGQLARVGLIPWFNQGFLVMWGWVFGAEYYDTARGKVTLNHPAAVRALEWLGGYARRSGAGQLAAFLAAANQVGHPLMVGRLAMQVGTNGLVFQIRQGAPQLQYGVSGIPPAAGQPVTTWIGGFASFIPRAARQLDAGWEFLRWLSSNEITKRYSLEQGGLPPSRTVAQAPEVAQDTERSAFVKLLLTGRVKAHPPLLGATYFAEMGAATTAVVEGQKLPQQALDDATQTTQRAHDYALAAAI